MSRRLDALIFVSYAILIATLTHWPNLKLETPAVERPDLFAHFAAYSIWVVLFWRTGWAGPGSSWWSVGRAVLLSGGYAGLDEFTQRFIPGRSVLWSDYLANLTGIAGGALAVSVWRWKASPESGGEHEQSWRQEGEERETGP